MAWFGDSKAHAEAGRKGGKAQGKHNNSGNFANDPEKASRAGKKGGSASPKKSL
ncbi:MAG TPA: KGG domain-containing protein [Methylomirabilota bacterium]|nr:KGG domain-containing protein [Methylomirabilota bacterium]